MSYCEQIRDKEIQYLQGTIHTLALSGCDQITGNPLHYLQGIIHTF